MPMTCAAIPWDAILNTSVAAIVGIAAVVVAHWSTRATLRGMREQAEIERRTRALEKLWEWKRDAYANVQASYYEHGNPRALDGKSLFGFYAAVARLNFVAASDIVTLGDQVAGRIRDLEESLRGRARAQTPGSSAAVEIALQALKIAEDALKQAMERDLLDLRHRIERGTG